MLIRMDFTDSELFFFCWRNGLHLGEGRLSPSEPLAVLVWTWAARVDSKLLCTINSDMHARTLLCSHLSDEEALLHVSRLDGSEKLHGLVLTLAGLELLPAPQHTLEQHQAHSEDDLDSWEGERTIDSVWKDISQLRSVGPYEGVTVTEEHVPDTQHRRPG